MVDRLAEQRPPEPATYRYFRQIGEWVQVDFMRYTQILDTTRTVEDLGPQLVDQFGARESRFIASEVGRLAQGDLVQNPDDRVAKNAARWARRAGERITDQGWQDSQQGLSQFELDIIESNRRYPTQVPDDWDPID